MMYIIFIIAMGLSFLLTPFMPIFLIYAVVTFGALPLMTEEFRDRTFRVIAPYDIFGPYLLMAIFMLIHDQSQGLKDGEFWYHFKTYGIWVYAASAIGKVYLNKTPPENN